MKLHLPKALFTAVLAAFALTQITWAETTASGDISSMLSSATGTDTITLTDNSTINAGTNSTFAGTLDVAAGKKLTYGSAQGESLSLESATVQLNKDSQLYVNAFGAKLGVLDVQDNANWWMEDSSGQSSPALTIGEVRIAAGKTLQGKTNWEGMITFDNLNAKGHLNLIRGSHTDSIVNINAIEASGNISIAGKNGVLTLGAGADSVLNLGGNVTADESKINIKGQLAGKSTISGGTINVEGTASVTGEIIFGSDITLAGTLQNSGSLELRGDVTMANYSLLIENPDVAKTYSHGQDGYLTSGEFYVVQSTDDGSASVNGSYTLTVAGSVWGEISASADGKNLVVKMDTDTPGVIWHVNTQDFTIDGLDSNLAKDATGYKVAASKTLTIAANQSGTMTAGKILSETTGDGNIKLTFDATMTGAAQAKGKLTVSGATLTVDAGATFDYGYTNTYLSSFTSIDLDDATINYQGYKTTWQSVTVGSNGATLNIRDMGEYPNDTVDMITFAGTTTLNGALTIQSAKFGNYGDSWKFGVNIESLTGEGDLSVISSTTADPSETSKVNVKLQETYTGTLSLTHNRGGATQLNVTADGNINLEGLNVSGGSGAQVDLSGVTGTKNLGDVSVGVNTTLNLQGKIGNMAATGDGTISLADGTAFTGTVSIDNGLTLAGTITNSGAFTLKGNVSIADLGELDSTGVYSDNGGKDGYMLSAQYIVVSTTGTGTATLGSDDLKLNDTYTLVKDGENIVFNVTEDEPTGDYYVNTTVDYTAGSAIAADTTTGITMNGGTLNLNTALAEDISISTAKSGSVINVADGVTLANSSVTAGSTKSTITGGKNAVFDLGTGLNGAMSSVVFNVNYGEQWEGITQITNSHIGENTLDNLCGGGKGTLKLVGLSGWLVRGQTVQADILLENYSVDGVTTTKSAFVFDDNSEDNYTFAGDISGSGDFQVASKSGSWAKLNFTGSTENWTGGIVVTNAYKYQNDTEKNATNEVTINLTHGGDIFSAEGNKGIVMDRTSTNTGNNIINLNIGNADTASTMNGAISMGDNADESSQLKLTVKGDTTFKKEVEVTSLTVDANKTATLEAETTTGSLTTNGTVKLTGAGSLTYGGTTTVAAPYIPRSNAEAAAATITSDAITNGTVSFNNAEDITESRVISDSSISKYGAGTANVRVGDENTLVFVAEGNIAMTADNGSTSVAGMNIAADSKVSTEGSLAVTDLLVINGGVATPALSVTGALTLTGAEIDLTNLTLQEGVTTYTLGTVTGGITADNVMITFGANQLANAGFEGYAATVGASDTDATALVLTLTAPTVEPTLTEIAITGGTYDATAGVLTLTTETDIANAVFGDKLNATMDDTTWEAIVGNATTTLPDKVLVSITDGQNYIDFDTNDDGTIDTALTINGEGITGTPVVGGIEVNGTPNQGTIVGNYVTAYIPEPTTTTLSLLALAGLAVRRRRASR